MTRPFQRQAQRPLTLSERAQRPLTLSERVKQALANGSAPAAAPGLAGQIAANVAAGVQQQQLAERCLLLDVSGSMAQEVEPGRSKIAALRELAAQFPGERKFAFGDRCSEVSVIPPPGGNTDMPLAFRSLKRRGIRHAVLITDGLPQDEEGSLREAKGLRLDIFYVGPPPEPGFLERLAKLTGGQFRATTLRRDTAQQLTTRVRGLLAAPR